MQAHVKNIMIVAICYKMIAVFRKRRHQFDIAFDLSLQTA